MHPHRWQPTRLPRPWDSPGKNTGVDCHFLLQCVKVKSLSRVRLLRPHGLQPTRLLCPWDFSRQEYWSGLPLPSLGSFLAVYKYAFVYLSKKYLSITSLQLLDTTLLLLFHLRQNSSRIFYSLSLDNSSLLSFSVSEMKVTQSCLTLCDSMDYI